ncbi:MAG: sugar phosphate isomerase/epimerase [Chloroflexi bacterium]|nr:sugar phosphate isomerase/epimerase [Chloroflexota bacterium]
MDLSTSLNVLYDPSRVTQLQAMERCVAAGFRHLDFNFTDWTHQGSPFIGEGWREWLHEIRRRADELGVSFSQSHGPIFAKFVGDERCCWLTEMSHRSIEGAGIIGAPWVVFEPESYPGAWDAAHLAGLKQRNLDWFGALLPTADRAGVGLALENINEGYAESRGMRRLYCAGTAELIDLVDGFRSSRVGICWDTGHAHIQRLDQGAAIRALGDRLKAVHIQDNDGRSDQHLLPYTGTIQWPVVLEALRAIHYGGDFTFEVASAIRPLPDPLRDGAVRRTYELGRYMLEMV